MPRKCLIVNKAFQELAKKLGNEKVEHVIEYERSTFVFTGIVDENLLGMTSVHHGGRTKLRGHG